MTTRTALMDVTVEVLPWAVSHMPVTYQIVGSMRNDREGQVRLMVASEHIPDGTEFMVLVISDEGSTRTARMVPT